MGNTDADGFLSDLVQRTRLAVVKKQTIYHRKLDIALYLQFLSWQSHAVSKANWQARGRVRGCGERNPHQDRL